MYFVSPQWILAKQKETRSDHYEDGANGAKDSLCRCDARETFGEYQALDDRVQRGQDVVSTFRLLGLCVHGFEVDVGVKEQERCNGQAVGKTRLPYISKTVMLLWCCGGRLLAHDLQGRSLT